MFKEAREGQYLTLPEVQSQVKDMYQHVNSITKVKLKSWLYYAEGRHEGGKKAVRFTEYDNTMNHSEYHRLVSSRCVICDDIGSVEKVKEIISAHYSERVE